MRIRNLFLFVNLCLCLSLEAQTLHLSGIFSGDSLQGTKLYVLPMSSESQGGRNPLNVSDLHFEGDVSVSPDGFYTLFGVRPEGQLIVPLYLPDKNEKIKLTLSMVDGCPQIDFNTDNQALSAFNAVYYRKGNEFWTKGKEMKPEQILSLLKSYKGVVDSIVSHYQCSEPVKKYLALWAYTLTSDNYNSISFITGLEKEEISFTLSDLLEEPSKVLDTPMALYFSSTGSTISQSLPKGTLSEKFAYLEGHYSCEPIRKKVADILITRYISSFNYEKNFDSGLAELEAVIEKYKLDTRCIKDFKARKASVKGADFPDVLLTDRDGNKVDFSQYKGYYVYVDMWASWCGPCCREVPYLQQLEKELKNDRIKFVSISIDKGTKEWKAKMEALNMHGNQLINQDNKLAEALNIAGIPHFLIYDKEGKLLQYKASRPSSGEELKQLLEGLR